MRAVAGKDLRVLWCSPTPYVVGALFQAVFAHVRAALPAPDTSLPDTLMPYSFSWTGGGVGPELA